MSQWRCTRSWNKNCSLGRNDNQGTSGCSNYTVTLGNVGDNCQWIFPEINQCPTQNCHVKYSNRLMAMEHFKNNHAKNYTLCKICGSLIARHNLQKHLIVNHPTTCSPLKYDLLTDPKFVLGCSVRIERLALTLEPVVSTGISEPERKSPKPIQNDFAANESITNSMASTSASSTNSAVKTTFKMFDYTSEKINFEEDFDDVLCMADTIVIDDD